MKFLENDELKVLHDCKAALEEVSYFLKEINIPKSAEIASNIEEMAARLNQQSKDFREFIDHLNAVIFGLIEIDASGHRAILDEDSFYGISIATRLSDARRGLTILCEHLIAAHRASKKNGPVNAGQGSNSDQLDNIHQKAEKIRRVIREGLEEYHRVAVDLPRLHGIEEFGGFAERTSELVSQVKLVNSNNQEDAVENLAFALNRLSNRYSYLLSLEPAGQLRTLFQTAAAMAAALQREITDGDSRTESTPTRAQAVAPFQFAITDDRLTLKTQTRIPKPRSETSVQSAFKALFAQAEDVWEDLKNSNHPRLLRSFKRLKNALGEGSGVVEIGMHCASFEGQVSAASEELSDSLLALLMTFSNGVMSYASQFEEWQIFSDNAAEEGFASEDADNFATIARVLATELELQQEVDEKVPQALRQAADWNDKAKSPRSRLSVGRTVLNIITVCFNELVTKPAKTLVGFGQAAIVAVVLHQAALSVAEISKTPEGAWLRPAVRVIERQLEGLTATKGN
ncbi:hypothetical protein [Agrobacterium tumefaciens]|uniref:hypothetical protein n=1 Tax=Agrobacterium tumefaciens TaxID=358 RepID=UPI002244377D|nr:hypothetical protein [Agrobacterium tumefaciens]MCW8059321.1 hypothetical protein [Agrobacterium tumefaciens]MCW8147105.1 hypothetical protein [Agrobacterium tumefaciens]